MENVLELRHITKRFPGIIANDKISLNLRKGEIHALLGENGAGKSTLMSIIFGLYRPDEGSIFVRGKEVTIDNPNKANDLGIGMVHQHFKLVDAFTILDNIIMGYEPVDVGMLDRKAAANKINELSKKYDLAVDLKRRVADVTIGMQQRTEILKMLYRNNDILIFDEPTAVLTPQEINHLMIAMKNLANEGKSILFITHKLDEIMTVADRVTIIRRGKVIDTLEVKNTNPKELSKLMVGRDIETRIEKTKEFTHDFSYEKNIKKQKEDSLFYNLIESHIKTEREKLTQPIEEQNSFMRFVKRIGKYFLNFKRPFINRSAKKYRKIAEKSLDIDINNEKHITRLTALLSLSIFKTEDLEKINQIKKEDKVKLYEAYKNKLKLKDYLPIEELDNFMYNEFEKDNSYFEYPNDLLIFAYYDFSEELLRYEGERKPKLSNDTVLDVENLTVVSPFTKKNVVDNVSFSVKRGEIVCIAGIDGNGQSELAYTISGMIKANNGHIYLNGEDITNKSIRYRNDNGISHIPENRQRDGLFMNLSLADNLAMKIYHQSPQQTMGIINKKPILEHAEKLIPRFDIRSGEGAKSIVGSMSGGNQQKAIIAREIDKDSDLLLAVQTVRGLDVGAIEFVHKEIVAQRDLGKAILMVSFELEEVMSISDRILVMFEGEIVGDLKPSEITVEELGLYMAGAKHD